MQHALAIRRSLNNTRALLLPAQVVGAVSQLAKCEAMPGKMARLHSQNFHVFLWTTLLTRQTMTKDREGQVAVPVLTWDRRVRGGEDMNPGGDRYPGWTVSAAWPDPGGPASVL